METLRQFISTPVVFVANDQLDAPYVYRQAFGKVNPGAVLFFFMHSTELIDALQGKVYPTPSLLIMDWNMAAHEGYTTLASLAQTRAWQTIPVVILSSLEQPVDEGRCEQLGYELILPKQTEFHSLVEQLNGLLLALL